MGLGQESGVTRKHVSGRGSFCLPRFMDWLLHAAASSSSSSSRNGC